LTDLAGALLRAMLGFADGRLREVERDALGAATDLAGALGGPGPGADLATADAELAQARGGLAAFRAALGGPVSVGAAQQAATELGAALRHVDRAVEAVRPGSTVATLLSGPFSAPVVPRGLAAQLGLRQPSTPTFDGQALTYRLTSGGPVTLSGSVPLRVGSGALVARLRLDGGPAAFGVDVRLADVSFTLQGAASEDGLVKALAGGGSSIAADLTVGVDTARGLTVAGATSGPVTVPAQVSGGVLDVRAVELDLPVAPGAGGPVAIAVGAQVGARLGTVLGFALDGVGVRVVVDADSVSTGTPARVEARRPRGVGAFLDAGPVRGGGYLEVSPTGYAGVLDVGVGPVQARAFGIVESTGERFSLVVSIGAEFDPAVEIALGFTLNGVGGLVGVEREVDTEALLDRIHDHAIEQLLFPADPAGAAPQILRALGAVFPARPGGLVVGPMVKLGWGRPVSFVTASLALVLQLPDPKIAVLGTFQMAVPSPSVPIVQLKGAVFSEITPEHILVLVVLEDSRVAGYPVTGDVGIVVGLGSDPAFAISAGGFHPRYPAPAELVGLRRLSIDLSPPVLLTIRASAYVALTTGSVQLGGRLEASGDAGPVSFHGFVQLDAIVRWAPSFSFEADLAAGFDMRFEGASFAGVRLSLHLTGPAPWSVHGTATLELPILPDVDVEVGPVTWGERHNPPPPLVHPRALVRAALADPSAWKAELPSDADRVVTVRDDPAGSTLLVHPLGRFEGRQRVVPLETTISRVGPSPVPANETRVHLGQPTLTQAGGTTMSFGAVSGVDDHFPPGQFLELSDDERLRRPAFEDMLAGVRLGPADGVRTVDPAGATQSDLHYDTVFPGMDLEPSAEPFHDLASVAFAVLAAGAAGRSGLRRDVRYATGKREPLVLAPAGNVRIRSAADLGVPAGVPDEPLTFTAASERLSELGAAGALQLVAMGTELA
jgi:hypothetical protein